VSLFNTLDNGKTGENGENVALTYNSNGNSTLRPPHVYARITEQGTPQFSSTRTSVESLGLIGGPDDDETDDGGNKSRNNNNEEPIFVTRRRPLLNHGQRSIPSAQASSRESSPMRTGTSTPNRVPVNMAPFQSQTASSNGILISNNQQYPVYMEIVDPGIDYSGILIPELRYGHRDKLAKILDLRLDSNGQPVKNWYEWGLRLVGGDTLAGQNVKRCHECYYGGGSAMEAMLGHLSMRRPPLTVTEFTDVCVLCGRNDIVTYLCENKVLGPQLFFQISETHRKRVSDMLDKRQEVLKYWKHVADEFGFSAEDIEYFQQRKLVPQKYSPTHELLIVLTCWKPQMAIAELQSAAMFIKRPDVCQCLADIARELNDHYNRSSVAV